MLVEDYKNLIDSDGEVYLIPDFLKKVEASKLQKRLLAELKWAEESIHIFGKPARVPRLVCWYGDSGAGYRYSGVVHSPLKWTTSLLYIKDRVEKFCGQTFNSVLGNLYRNGNDSMGWHSDKEQELGLNPVIASLSLGATRLFKIQHNKTRETRDLHLTHASLLLMGGNFQYRWRHCLPKSRGVANPRINLTFRKIIHLC